VGRTLPVGDAQVGHRERAAVPVDDAAPFAGGHPRAADRAPEHLICAGLLARGTTVKVAHIGGSARVIPRPSMTQRYENDS
jgi:hypothetical protein